MHAPPSIAPRLLASCAGFAIAVALALAAAHWYVVPNTGSTVSRSAWLEPDFVCAFASSAVALMVGAWSGRAARGVGATAARSLAARVAIWAAFTVLFGAIWLEYLVLFTLVIAPTHAFTGLRLIGLLSRWRTDVAWRRRSE